MHSDLTTYDAVIVGGGHNGLVAACYLAKAKKKVLLLESNDSLGGATASIQLFPDYEAYLSRYSYLVSLLPDQIVKDLGIQFTTLPRAIASYTPGKDENGDFGLLIASEWDKQTADSFRRLTGSDKEGFAWRSFYEEVAKLAQRLAPSLLKPLRRASDIRSEVALPGIWQELIETPIGEVIENRFQNDLVRGVALTDALIGTFASDKDFNANACFLYHLIGNGTGQWRVPKGGMGQLIGELERIAISLGVTIHRRSKVTEIESGSNGIAVRTESGQRFCGRNLVFAAAPQRLANLLNQKEPESLPGSQLKINMLVSELPKLKSGVDPELAFAGTLHINESFLQLRNAFSVAQQGDLPDPLPLEIYCHTLADQSILSDELSKEGFHTLTLFALHTPHNLFTENPSEAKSRATDLALKSLNEYLLDPIESVLAPCGENEFAMEVMTPLDLQSEVGLPRGNIFHNQLSFPFLLEGEEAIGKAKWGVATEDPHIVIGGAGARRGGGVSGIAGHNAAMAILEAN